MPRVPGEFDHALDPAQHVVGHARELALAVDALSELDRTAVGHGLGLVQSVFHTRDLDSAVVGSLSGSAA